MFLTAVCKTVAFITMSGGLADGSIPSSPKGAAVIIKKEDLLVRTGNHGGYIEGYCPLCRTNGWIDEIDHKKDCPMLEEGDSLKIVSLKG
jgi:hypothetical protein